VKSIYKFILGNSRLTPIGLAVAVVAALALPHVPAAWRAGLYVGVLVCTLAASSFEPVQ
jgi:hypothetical protein